MKNAETLQEFLAAQKPEWCIPVDVILGAQLILIDGQPYPGDMVLKMRCGLRDVKAIARALGRLKAAGWIIKVKINDVGGYAYAVQANKLPRKEAK